MRFVLVILVGLIVSVSFAQQVPEKTFQDILKAQDLRDAKTLTAFLSDKKPEVKSLAAFACGSVQDTSHITLLLGLLSDKGKDVRTAAAFALGQMNYTIDSTQRLRIPQSLLKRLGFEQNRLALARIVEALGKVGDEYSLNVMVASGENFPTTSLKCEAALSVGRYAYRGMKSKTATSFAVDVLNSVRSGDEWKAAYALMRITDTSLLSKHTDEILKFASNPNASVRMFIATALGRIASSRKVSNTLLSLAVSDKDWRVRVNALKSITRVDSTFHARMIPLLLQTFADSNEHVSLTALSAFGDLRLRKSPFSAECRKAFIEVIIDDKNYSQRQKKEAAIALAKTMGEEAYLILADKFGTGHLTKGSYVASLAFTPVREAMANLIAFSKEGDVRLQREALEAIQSAAKLAHEDSAMVEIAKPAFVEALESKDMAVITTAASALADSAFADERSVPLLSAALRRLKSPDDTEAMVAVIQALADLKATGAVAPLESHLNDHDHVVASEAAKALEKITGKSYKHLVKQHSTPSYTNFDWKLLEWIRKNALVNVRTSKGSFKIRMLPNEAPFTCMNFATLIKKGFFDSLLFHRVVPNFVIQGGDPRGDGWGGPGYAIRSEFGFEHYERGMVGVASSGKDTEGCQWFVTHCNTPHLDGRYTIFGRVISGMDVVDKIQVGDKIEKMFLSD
ncbi:MAG: peptidylprolyl isomerase [Bacteroidota bacterium]